jgi:hypothetical protein
MRCHTGTGRRGRCQQLHQILPGPLRPASRGPRAGHPPRWCHCHAGRPPASTTCPAGLAPSSCRFRSSMPANPSASCRGAVTSASWWCQGRHLGPKPRWGVNYLYGTWQVLRGLHRIGQPMDEPFVRRAASWTSVIRTLTAAGVRASPGTMIPRSRAGALRRRARPPGPSCLNCHLYRHYFPLMALAQLAK